MTASRLSKLALAGRAFALHFAMMAAAAMSGCNPGARTQLPEVNSPEVKSTPESRQEFPPPKLTVRIDGFRDRKGRCRVALYRDAQGFNQPDKAWLKETLDIPPQGVLVWSIEPDDQVFEAASQTRWAISAHQDRNGNDKLDKNAFGIPTEPYGFSNNPKRGFGPPEFDEVSFEIRPNADQQGTLIEIQLQ